MLNILSHEVMKRGDVWKRGHQLFDVVLQIDLKKGDSALVEGGTELLIVFDNEDKDIDSYAFVPKNDPSRPTISVSFKEGEWEQVRAYCEKALN